MRPYQKTICSLCIKQDPLSHERRISLEMNGGKEERKILSPNTQTSACSRNTRLSEIHPGFTTVGNINWTWAPLPGRHI